jgi:hypothetical protein
MKAKTLHDAKPAAPRAGPLPVSCEPAEDVLNWDVYIATPPPRPHGTIEVRLEKGGRGRPTVIDDPDAG